MTNIYINDKVLKNFVLLYMIKENWRKWAVLEGLMKTASSSFQKIAGSASSNFAGTLLVAGIIGLTQVIFALTYLLIKKEGLLIDRKGIFGSMLFGLVAFSSTVFGIITFLKGGDVSVNTFIITLSIVPGMIIDIVFFKYKPRNQEWLGMIIAIIAGWAVLNFPTTNIKSLPTWVCFSFGNMLCLSINQGISQKIKNISPMFKNFWGGMVALILATTVIILIGRSSLFLSFTDNKILWFTSALIGLIVIAMWSFNLLSYRDGASIALKKLVMSSTYLLGAMLLGYIIFQEKITIGKLVAIPLFAIAYVLMDRKAYDFIFTSTTKSEVHQI